MVTIIGEYPMYYVGIVMTEPYRDEPHADYQLVNVLWSTPVLAEVQYVIDLELVVRAAKEKIE